MPTRKSTTSTARVIYTSPEGRVVVTRNEDGDYILSVDDQFAGAYQYAHTAEQAGLVELERRVKQERFAAADEAAEAAAEQAAASAMDAALDLTCACELCGGAVLPEQAHLVGEQMACPHCEAEAYYASPASDDAALAARNFTDEADEADEAYQQAYRSGAKGYGIVALARGAAPSLMDVFTMSDQAWSAAIARHDHAPTAPSLHEALAARGYTSASEGAVGRRTVYAADGARIGSFDAHEAWAWLAALPPTGTRLLSSWAGNAKALGAVVSERRAAWMAQQQRWLLAADAAGLAAAEHYEVA